MKITHVIASALALGLVLAAPHARAQKAAKGGAATLTSAADLKWADVPGMQGIAMAVAEGDPSKGPSHFFAKFAAGFAAPEHHHSADHFVTVVSGNVTLTVDGKENKLGPGSFFTFSGKKVHATKCDAGADCVLFVDARGKWDIVPEAAPKAAPAKAEPKK